MSRFNKFGISVKPSKCMLGTSGLDFLGHYLGQGIQQPQDKTLEKIKEFPIPHSKKQVQSFLGLCNYYSEFIPGYTQLSQPLIELTKKNKPVKIVWNNHLNRNFQDLKNALQSKPTLYLPKLDKPFLLQTDASATGIGAVLMQEIGNVKRPIHFWSRKLKPAEVNYSTIEKECLGVVEGIRKFKKYLYGDRFVLETDHQPLSYLKNYSPSCKNGRLARWSLFLQDFSFEINYIPGKQNVIADYLSRCQEDSSDRTLIVPGNGINKNEAKSLLPKNLAKHSPNDKFFACKSLPKYFSDSGREPLPGNSEVGIAGDDQDFVDHPM